MRRLAVVLALINTALLAVIAIELYPIAQAARVATAIAAGVTQAVAARENETDEQRRARIAADAAAMEDSFTAGLEAARRSAQSLRSSRQRPAP
jgi:hypothetical protein